LVSWWPGEGNANDIVSANNGTLSGGASFASGEVGQAFDFNPASGSVIVPDSPSLRLTNQLTIEAWINARSSDAVVGCAIVSKISINSGNNGYQFILVGDTLQGLFNSPGLSWPSQRIISGPIINTGVWYHVAFTYDQSAMKLYCNGQPVATNVIGAHAITTSPSELRISGADNHGYFDGLIDEPSVYNRALSAGEIAAIYNAGSAGKCGSAECVPPPASLVSWWPGEGNAYDIMGANNGTLSGGVTFTNGEVGQAFSFDPANGTVIVPDSPILRLTNQLTIEAWVNTRTLSGPDGYGIVSKVGFASGNNGYQFILVGNTLQGLLNSPGLSWPSQRIISGPIISTAVWYHVAFTYDQSAMKLYCNGQPVATNVIGAHAIATSVSDLRISGADNHCYFDGLIDEPSVYNRALSAGEIAAIYNAGSAGKCVTPSSNCIPPPSGLVGWWPGEGNANDIVGANNGTLSGGASFASGKVGQAFSFDGINGTVTVPDSSSLRLTTQLTIEAWINPHSTNEGDQAIVSKVGIANGNNGYQLYLSQQNTLSGQFNSPGQNWPGNVIAYNYSSAIVPNTWHHVAWTYDQSAMKLYLNGLPVATNVIGPQSIAVSSTDLRISGADNHVYFNGLIDEPAVYNRALSASEIAGIYGAGSAGKCRPNPIPRGATAVATIVNGFVVGVTITDGGWGYTSAPVVRISGAGGSGARAIAVVSNGVVIAVNILDAGSGYTNKPDILIAPPSIPQPTMDIEVMSLLSFTNLAVGTHYQFQFYSGSTWSNLGAAFTAASSTFTQFVSGTVGRNDYRLATTPVPGQAYATAQVINGFVVGATVTSGGSGYGSNVVVSIVGGGGNGATATATVSGGVVTKITITDAGIGYTSAPTIMIASPSATALGPNEVTQVMGLDLGSLLPYQDYQLEFAPVIGGAWTNRGIPFTPTSTADTQYVNVIENTGYFRVRYVP
jgi:hypothetical protein